MGKHLIGAVVGSERHTASNPIHDYVRVATKFDRASRIRTAIAFAAWFGVSVCGTEVRATVLLNNFDTVDALTSSGFGIEHARTGRVCCPPAIDPNFEEQSAMGFTLSQTARLTGFEIVVRDGGNVDSLSVLLTKSSSDSPGGLTPDIDFLAPDFDQVVEGWQFENQIPSDRTLLSIISADNPILSAGELYWLALIPGRDVNFGEIIDINWVTGSISQGPSLNFGRRNNVSGGDIDDVPWVVGAGGIGYTFRISGDLVPLPEPTTLALFGLGLAGIGYARRRRGERR